MRRCLKEKERIYGEERKEREEEIFRKSKITPSSPDSSRGKEVSEVGECDEKFKGGVGGGQERYARDEEMKREYIQALKEEIRQQGRALREDVKVSEKKFKVYEKKKEDEEGTVSGKR